MAIRDSVPLGQRVEIDLSVDPQKAIQKVAVDFLAKQDVVVEFPAKWSWDWLLPKEQDGFSGTLPKRISKLHYIQHKKRISLKVQSDLGELLKRLLPEPKLHLFDFTDVFDWAKGDFGDPYSCFAADPNKKAFNELKEHGGFAMRHWDEDGLKGLARCLLCPVADEHLALFNAYGKLDGGVFAQALARLLKTEMQPVSNMETGSKDGKGGALIYSTGSGYLIGPLTSGKALMIAHPRYSWSSEPYQTIFLGLK